MNWRGHFEPEVFDSIEECIMDCEITFINIGFERCEVADALDAYRKYLEDGRQGPFRFNLEPYEGRI
jgi:hypothetical protein